MMQETRQAYRLAELVRLLQESGHLFPADPAVLTEALRHAPEDEETRLLTRARLIDSDHALRQALEQTERRARMAVWLLTALWLAAGFGSTVVLLEQSGLNFFLLLFAVLGGNSVMLLLWLWAIRHKPGSLLQPDPAWLVRGQDATAQALLSLYTEEWHSPSARWRLSALSHRFWLASLCGMSAAVLLLLSVRQYSFSWESTLLSDGTLAAWVHYLSALPALLGFPVPDAAAVAGSRTAADWHTARQWGGLLIGCILVYGLLPRLAAWLFCLQAARRHRPQLPLQLPYYSRIVQQWRRRVVDADNVRETAVAAILPPETAAGSACWAVMLERPWLEGGWFNHVLGLQWTDQGTADSREAVAALAEALAATPARLLIGVALNSVPDRGLLRQMRRLADAASGGAVVQLLCAESVLSDGLHTRLQQWHQALDEHRLPRLDPPRPAQLNALKRPTADE